MARAAVLGRLTWQLAEVVEIRPETPTVSTLVLDVPGWPGHLAGQHIDVRLTAEDGYQAERSYSIASAPENSRVELAVERLEGGEVSPYLVDEVRAGDRFEMRGPIGGYFVWEASMGGPLTLLAGGSGIAPLMAMLRHRAAAAPDVHARLLYSARSAEEIVYGQELDAIDGGGESVSVVRTLTRSQPPGWQGYSRRIDREMLQAVAWPKEDAPLTYICGPTAFAETAGNLLVEMGHSPMSIRIERFGPTGQ